MYTSVNLINLVSNLKSYREQLRINKIQLFAVTNIDDVGSAHFIYLQGIAVFYQLFLGKRLETGTKVK